MTRLWVLLILLWWTVPSWATGPVARLITGKEARLYQENKAKLILPAGQIVLTADHPKSPEWLLISHNAQTYEARRGDFTALDDLVFEQRRWRDAAELDLKTLNDDLTQLGERQKTLVGAIRLVERDAVLYFRQVYTRVAPQGPPTVKPDGPVKPAPDFPTTPDTPDKDGILVMQGFRYVALLTGTRSKRLIRDWQEALADLGKQAEAAQKRRLELLQQLSAREIELRHTQARFQRFAADREGYLSEPWQVGPRAAALFQERVVKLHLNPGTVVLGQPSQAFNGWLSIRHQAAEYQADGRAFRNGHDTELALSRTIIDNEDRGQRLAGSVAALREEERVLTDMMLDLELRANTSGDFVVANVLRVKPGGNNVYNLETPGGSVVVLSRSKARTQVKEWEKERLALEAQRRKLELELKAVTDKNLLARRELQQQQALFAQLLTPAPAPAPTPAPAP